MQRKLEDKEYIDWMMDCRQEADQAKTDRKWKNKDNFDMFHLKHDFSHKQEGQSTEVLSKQSMAVEQIKSFFQQALADLGEWWSAEAKFSENELTMAVRPHEITIMTNYMLDNALYFTHVGNTIESALLGALGISKTYGVMKDKPKFVSRKKGRGKSLKRWVEKTDDDTWRLKFDVVRQENYYPDPTGAGLYEIEDMWVDHHILIELATGDDAIYDMAEVKKIPLGGITTPEKEYNKSRETGQNPTHSSHRAKVKVTEYWGDIIDKGTQEIVYENVVFTVANDTILIRPPTENPLWHQRSPYTASPLMEVANSVWHKAAMDAPTQHNRALNELYNLVVDAAMKQVHAISQIRKDALDNPAQVADGIKPGQTIGVNSLLPVGGKVLEPLTAVQIPAEALNIFNIMSQEFNASALTNDLRQGVMPFRAVKATEVVEASQTITSVFQGMAKNYEARQSVKELELAWMTTAQNWDKISKEEFISLFGKERGEQLSQLSAQDVFAATVDGVKFRVFGITMTLGKAQDYKKLTTLMQTVFSNPMLTEIFLKKYDPVKFLEEIMTALNIDKHKLEIPVAHQMTMQGPQQGAPEQGGPDQMSQVPQPGAGGSINDMMGMGGAGPQIPHSKFPGSPALVGGNIP